MILDGKKLANKILSQLIKEVAKLPPMRLAVVLVGDNPSSISFIKQKQQIVKKIGAGFKLYKFSKDTTEQKLIKELNKIIKIETNTGVLVQLPLPKHIEEQKVLNMVPPEQDVDALSVDNQLVESPTASGIMRILKEYNIKVRRKNVVIVGKGNLVGKPLAIMMKKTGANLMICDRQTENLASKTRKADILISATGQPHLIKEKMIKKGATVIDAGFSKKNGKITGDVDFENVKKRTGYITPVPGGVGPLTIAMLMNNLIKLAKKHYEVHQSAKT